MEHWNEQQTQRLPGEVVEVYRRNDPREVVETYSRPLPGRVDTAAAPEALPVKKKKSRKGLWIFLACLLVLSLISAAGIFLYEWILPSISFHGEYYFGPHDAYHSSINEEVTIPTYPIGQGGTLAVQRETGEAMPVQEIYRQVNPSVVTVMVQMENDMSGVSIGTGVIFSEDGYILTNHHVVAGGSICIIALDSGYTYDAMYVAGDVQNDLAVLKIDVTGLPAAEFGDSDLLAVGDPVYAIGNPLGVELRGTLTDGIVSAINRDVQVDNRTMTLIQTNAALNTGNSGGPLINQYGQVVGINVVKKMSSESTVEGLGFAIPSASAQRIVNDLLTYGKLQPEPLLGVTAMNVADRLEEDVWGLEVVEVLADSAADKAGIRTGDYLIAADGEQLLSTQDLLRVRRRHYVGDEMQMTLWRDGKMIEVILVLEQVAE